MKSANWLPDITYYNYFLIDNLSQLRPVMSPIYDDDIIIVFGQNDRTMDVLKEFNDDIFKFVTAMGYKISKYNPNKEYPKYSCVKTHFDEEEMQFVDNWNYPDIVICDTSESPRKKVAKMTYLNDVLLSYYVKIRIYDKKILFKAISKKLKIDISKLNVKTNEKIIYFDKYLSDLKNKGLLKETELKRVIDMDDLSEKVLKELKIILK